MRPSKELLEAAYQYVLQGNSITSAKNKYRLSYYAFRNYFLNRNKHRNPQIKIDVDEVFNFQQESEVKEMIKTCEFLFYGLTEGECRKLVYEMACMYKYDVQIPDVWREYKSADLNWLGSFQSRHIDLNILKVIRCGATHRELLVLKRNVNTVYDSLERIFVKDPRCKDPSRIFCLGETCIKPNSFFTSNTKRNRFWENLLVTTCCLVSAAGSLLPPVNIYPSKDYQIPDNPSGVMSLNKQNGKLSSNDFLKVMEHFVNCSNSSTDNPSVLIMDTNISHMSVPALILAKQSGVHLVTVHQHLTDLLLPLGMGLLKSFHSYCNASLKSWVVENYGTKIPDKEHPTSPVLGNIIGEAYEKTMTPENIRDAFHTCGVSPFDRDLFSDDDFYPDAKLLSLPCANCKMRNEISKFVLDNEIDALKRIGCNDGDPRETEGEGEVDEESKKEQNVDSNRTDKVNRIKPKMPRVESPMELDKLKRRMIRTVARLRKEKKTEEEVWSELSKESGSNCRKLWDRMRSLTLKKLKRLQEADDKVDNVSIVARMTLTDWLFYDMIIVHEKIDTEEEEELISSNVMVKLFSLVQMFNIEALNGDQLAEAWTSATLFYNSNGFQCSPMMMQRRWYLLKKITRNKFYNFWFSYRGNNKLLPTATKVAPTQLQRDVAMRYSYIVTNPFPEWEEMIAKRMIIMPEEFQDKLRSMQGQGPVKKKSENAPDIMIIEPKVDTICLGDSDSDNEEKDNVVQEPVETDTQDKTPMIVQVKTEPEDTIDVEQEKELSFYDKIEKHVLNEENSIVNEAVKNIVDEINAKSLKIDNDNIRSEINAPSAETETNVNELDKDFDIKSQESILIDDDDEIPETEDNTDSHTNDNENIESNEQETLPVISAVTYGKEALVKTEINIEIIEEEEDEDECDIIMFKDDENKKALQSEEEIPSNLNFVDDGIEYADDGIEYVDEDDDENDSENSEAKDMVNNPSTNEASQDAPKFDLKLLMNPVVYTTKLDDMDVYKDIPLFDTIEEKEQIDKIIIESKPISTKAINVETAKENILADVQDDVDDDVSHNDVQNDDLFQHIETSDDDYAIDDSIKVRLTSYLLRKPRNPSYHPIQICKNPDFNTRLKRLNVGFFSYSRNRLFLKACKPLTIDVSKAFESKLVDGKLYLKKSDGDANIIEVEDVTKPTVATTVVPSSVAVQSLMPHDTTDVDLILQEELKKRMLERNKVINLPHISVVRQINEQLQKAAVAPIMAQNFKNNEQSLTKHDQGTLHIDDSKDSKTDTLEKNIDSIINTVQGVSKLIDTETVTAASQSLTNTDTPTVPAPIADTQSKAEKQKTKKKKPGFKHWASWTQKPLYLEKIVDNNEMLLTADTLYKMLTALDPGCVKKIASLKEKNMPPKKDEQATEQINEEQKTKQTKATKNKETEKMLNKETNITTDEVCVDKPSVMPQLCIKEAKPVRQKRKRCCWATQRLEKLLGKIKFYGKHFCPTSGCVCCCKSALEAYYKENALKLGDKQYIIKKDDDLPTAAPVPKIRVNAQVQTSPEHGTDKQSDSSQTEPNQMRVYSGNKSQVIQPKKGSRVPKMSQTNSGMVACPCTCNADVTVHSHQRKLCIDATNDCSLHKNKTKPTERKEKKIYINRKSIDITERPYYLGKNKILLTDIKKPVIAPDPMTLLVPDGVEVTLLPNGMLTYSVKPNVVLTPSEKANMPIILSMVQEQIKAVGVLLPENDSQLGTVEIIDLERDETSNEQNYINDGNQVPSNNISTEKVGGNNENEINDDTSNEVTGEPNNIEYDSIQEVVPESCLMLDQQQTEISDNLPVDSMPETATESIASNTQSENISEKEADNTENPVTKESDSNSGNTGTSRNLLSDLMEMSGIVEEDIAPAAEETVLQESVPELTVPVPSLTPVGQIGAPIPANVDDNSIKELHPVTSFADLKYACDNGGNFFKLDLNTGTIAPINVCIQKTSSKTSNLALKCTDVIDLTDEPGVTVSEPNDTTNASDMIITTEPSNTTKDSTKNIRVYKPANASSSMLKTVPNLLKPKIRLEPRTQLSPAAQKLINRLPNTLKPLKLIQAQQQADAVLRRNERKQLLINKPLKRLNRIDTNINLVDSDAPMEEEYLVDGSSDDSSDDEPLAKVAKRMRSGEENDRSSNGTPQNEPIEENLENENVDSEMIEEELDEEVSEDGNDSQVLDEELLDSESTQDTDSIEPRPTQLVLSGDAVNKPLLDSFMPQDGVLMNEDDADSQDDCILGF